MNILTVKDLTKTYSSGFWPFKTSQTYTAVNDISFDLAKGEILGFLGPNGAGKTTTIQMLLGTLQPTSGSIEYFGKNFLNNRVASLRMIGYASGYDRLPSRLTVAENLDIVGRIYGIPLVERAQRIMNLLNTFGIEKLHSRSTGSLSAGQMTRVLLAKAFINNPAIVLLDEPTASLDPDVAQEVRQFILMQRKERGISMLITSHNMDEVTQLCDRVLVLKQGAIIANNTPEELARSIALVRVHLIITDGMEALHGYARDKQLIYSQEGARITIEIDEHMIAQMLADLSARTVLYSHISIDKPTLEDYFLSIAR